MRLHQSPVTCLAWLVESAYPLALRPEFQSCPPEKTVLVGPHGVHTCTPAVASRGCLLGTAFMQTSSNRRHYWPAGRLAKRSCVLVALQYVKVFLVPVAERESAHLASLACWGWPKGNRC